MFNLPFKTPVERFQWQDKTFEESFQHPNRVFLRKGVDVAEAVQEEYFSNVWPRPHPEEHRDPSWVICGGTEILPNQLYGLTLRRNLTLLDAETRKPFLQRFGPRGRREFYEVCSTMHEGRSRFEKVLASCKLHTKGATEEDASSDAKMGHFQFGVLYPHDSPGPAASADTKQADNDRAHIDVLHFLAWLQLYVERYVQPFVSATNESGCLRDIFERASGSVRKTLLGSRKKFPSQRSSATRCITASRPSSALPTRLIVTRRTQSQAFSSISASPSFGYRSTRRWWI